VQTSANRLCMLSMAVARASSDGVAKKSYLFPVLSMRSRFHAQWRRSRRDIVQSDSPGRSTNLAPRRALKPTHPGGGGGRAESDVYDWVVVGVADKTPTSRQLDELTDQLRQVDSSSCRGDRPLAKTNVRVWFQNRRREHRQLLASSPSSSSSSQLTSSSPTRISAASTRRASFAPGANSAIYDCLVASSSSQLPFSSSPASAAVVDRLTSDVSERQLDSRDKVMGALTRLARYCTGPTDITNTYTPTDRPPPPLCAVDIRLAMYM